jgi:3-hydroxyisobutyrate dehydrogenase
MQVGFIGLGIMGQPMALNLVRAGRSLTVWNRTPARVESLRAAGARVAPTPGAVFRVADVVIMMLVDATAIDSVLGRGTPQLARHVNQRLIVHMGTTAPGYSAALEADIRGAGGEYVEAPVSGSKTPAEAGELLAMVAGDDAALGKVRDLFSPMCRDVMECGAVPNATLTKLGSNLLLIAMVTGLAEAMHFANQNRLPVQRLVDAVLGGPLASDVTRVKAPKLAARDFDTQASIRNVLENAKLVHDAAAVAGASTPLLSECVSLYREACELGAAELDMVAVIQALEARATDSTDSG